MIDDGAEAPGREAVVARWLALTRVTLPGLAVEARWPIALDHCFMRVFLDYAMNGRWDLAVARPAIRHMALADLRRTVAMAELVAAEPWRLAGLNATSLEWRQDERAAQRRVRAAGAGAAAGAGTRGGV